MKSGNGVARVVRNFIDNEIANLLIAAARVAADIDPRQAGSTIERISNRSIVGSGLQQASIRAAERDAPVLGRWT